MPTTLRNLDILFNNSTAQGTAAFTAPSIIVNTAATVHSIAIPSGARQITVGILVASFTSGGASAFLRAKDSGGNIITFVRNPNGATTTASVGPQINRNGNTVATTLLPPNENITNILFASNSFAYQNGAYTVDIQLLGVSGGNYYYNINGSYFSGNQSGNEYSYPGYAYMIRSTAEIRSLEWGANVSSTITMGATYTN